MKKINMASNGNWLFLKKINANIYLSLPHKNMSNLTGRSGFHIFIFLKRGRKILKIKNSSSHNVLGESR